MNAQYRALMQNEPVAGLLGGVLGDREHQRALPVFFHYFDFCNEQAFLREKRRIRKTTWKEWRDGMEENLRGPAFARAWTEIVARMPESFDEIPRLSAPKPPQGQVGPRAP